MTKSIHRFHQAFSQDSTRSLDGLSSHARSPSRSSRNRWLGRLRLLVVGVRSDGAAAVNSRWTLCAAEFDGAAAAASCAFAAACPPSLLLWTAGCALNLPPMNGCADGGPMVQLLDVSTRRTTTDAHGLQLYAIPCLA